MSTLSSSSSISSFTPSSSPPSASSQDIGTQDNRSISTQDETASEFPSAWKPSQYQLNLKAYNIK
jgi:hypothetical protein